MYVFLSACFINTIYGQTNFYEKLADFTLTLTKQKVKYDPTYFTLKYPNGVVPSDKDVCTEVTISAYRKLGIDLQKEVHEDMHDNFKIYPQRWGIQKITNPEILCAGIWMVALRILAYL